jgi:hypothetical protein
LTQQDVSTCVDEDSEAFIAQLRGGLARLYGMYEQEAGFCLRRQCTWRIGPSINLEAKFATKPVLAIVLPQLSSL